MADSFAESAILHRFTRFAHLDPTSGRFGVAISARDHRPVQQIGLQIPTPLTARWS